MGMGWKDDDDNGWLRWAWQHGSEERRNVAPGEGYE